MIIGAIIIFIVAMVPLSIALIKDLQIWKID